MVSGVRYRCRGCGAGALTDSAPEECDSCDGVDIEVKTFEEITDPRDLLALADNELENGNYHSLCGKLDGIFDRLRDALGLVPEQQARVARILAESFVGMM